MEYRWPNESMAESLTLSESGGRVPHVGAVLMLADGSAPSAPQRALLAARGFGVLEDLQDGRRVLRIGGKGDGQALLAALQESGLTSGQAASGEHGEARPEKDGKSNAQKAANSYLVGNGLALASGLLRRKVAGWGEFNSGLIFAGVDGAMRLLGKKDEAEQERDLLARLGGHLGAAGIPVDASNPMAMAPLQRPQSAFGKARQWIQDNIIILKLLSEIWAGFEQARGGFAQRNTLKGAGGAVLAAGGVISLLIPEGTKAQLYQELIDRKGAAALDGAARLKPYEQLLKESPLATRAMHYLRGNPLKLPFTFARINNILLMAGALNEAYHSRGEESQLERNKHAELYGGEVHAFLQKTRPTTGAIRARDREAAALDGLSGPARIAQEARLRDAEAALRRAEGEYAYAQKTWPRYLWIANAIQAVTWWRGNSLMSGISKSVEGGAGSRLADTAILAAANAMRGLPEAQRDGQVASTAHFLAAQHEVGLRADEVELRLQAKIAELGARHAASVAAEEAAPAQEKSHQQRLGQRPLRNPPSMQKPSGWGARREAEAEAAEAAAGQGPALA